MTDSNLQETKPGPPSPQAQGTEAATPPGGPQRQDDKDAGVVRPGHDDDASASRVNDKHASEAGGHTIPIEDEESHPRPAAEEDDVQEENAETSLDQPSEG
jgi:hypothetical protein